VPRQNRIQVYLSDETLANVKADMARRGHTSVTEYARVALSYYAAPPATEALTHARPQGTECAHQGCTAARQTGSLNCMEHYDRRVRYYESEGMTRSDAQGVVDAEDLKAAR